MILALRCWFRHNPQSKHTKHNQPLGVLHTLLIGLGVTERSDIDLVGLVDFILGTVTDEHGLTTPLDDDLSIQVR